MKIPVYYVVRVYKDGSARIDSGPHKDWEDADAARETDHFWGAERFDIFETYIEGQLCPQL